LFDPQIDHRVDFAFIAEPGALGVYEDLPNSKTTGELLNWIESQPSYTLVESFPTPSGESYHLFMAAPNFSSFLSIKGLAEKTDPLPLPGTPVVVGAIDPRIILEYDSPTDGEARLELALRGQPPASSLSVIVDGASAGEIPVVRSADFPESEISIPLRKGKNQVELILKTSDGGLVANPRTQFRRIRITPAGDESFMQDILRKGRE
jgi:hypothetical protein